MNRQPPISIENLQELVARLPNPYDARNHRGAVYAVAESPALMNYGANAADSFYAAYHEFTLEEMRDRHHNRFLRWAYRGKVLV